MNYRQKAEIITREQQKLLLERNFTVSEPAPGNYCFEFTVSRGKEKVKVQNFYGSKGNKTLMQGNKESLLYAEVHSALFGESLFPGSDEETEPGRYIGTDESGKGDFFGPLITAGVLVDEKSSIELKKAGVKDSKLLSSYLIRKLTPEIRNIVGNNFNIVIINPERYNTLYENFGNLNRMLGWAHARVLENILDRQDAETAISDKFGDEKYIISSLQAKGKNLRLLQFHRAEKYTAVAAASILARAKMMDWFEEAEKKYKMNIPKGASPAVESAAKQIKEKYGEQVLNHLVKKHFKTTQKL